LEDPIVHEEPMRDLLLAVDLSGSMDAEDFTDAQGKQVDRLTAVKQVLEDFLAKREGDRVGLVFFGSAAFVQAPFTSDLDVVGELLDEARVRMLGPRTMLGDALGLGINLFERSEVEERVMILLTDGNDTGSLVPPERAAGIAADLGVTIHTVAIGDPEAVGEQALDEATLRTVAERTGGGFYRADDRAAMADIYAELDQLNPRQVETISYRPRRDLFAWPLALAMVLVLLRLGAVILRARRTPLAGVTA
ncbi:MAG: VWA domain-containing protein, partial [Pseudomonadota bacterium]